MQEGVEKSASNCYGVFVGINTYRSSAQMDDLCYAENDAQALYDFFRQKGWPDDHCQLLLGENATLVAIQHALEDMVLTKPGVDDLVIFSFAGHSLPIAYPQNEPASEARHEVFLVAHDFDLQRTKQMKGAWHTYALRMGRLRTDFFECTDAKKVLFLFDSCYSGDFYGEKYRGGEALAHEYIERAFTGVRAGRIVLSSCMPLQKARELHQLQHGLFTYHLLQAFNGQALQAITNDGWATVGSVFEYLSSVLPDNQRPVRSGVEQGSFRLFYYGHQFPSPSQQKPLSEEKPEQVSAGSRLEAMLSDHRGFINDRLESFVGRQKELVTLRQMIERKYVTGGYVTITGQAGQGKSSIISKLVDEFGMQEVAYHFIPFNPGPDHQVNLLRNLMGRLILKYHLPDFYVASESRPVLRDYFVKVLAEVSAQDGREAVFVDGLDQIEEEQNGVRDLSFLPNNPPPGIVFVLGTRPNDTLRPLELLKPRHEYQLPNLSRSDFDLLLQHRHVLLSPALADRFYNAMQENALYLGLVARELAAQDISDPTEIIQQIATNPDNIFSLAIARFKRQAWQWRVVLKPMLGILLVASEPMYIRHMRQLLGVDDDEVRHGLIRLGGLIAEDSQGRRYLFHLKLQDYLRQDQNQPDKDYVFARDEEAQWHQKLVAWCELGGIDGIWRDKEEDADEQSRRIYARKYYVAHLFRAGERKKLYHVLDTGSYGRAKVRYDPSTRSYTQDLDLGRQLLVQQVHSLAEGIQQLPRLWRYTLLHSSLTSRADSYTREAFRALLLLEREQEALSLAELLTDPTYKVHILLLIVQDLSTQTGRRQDRFRLLMRSYEIVKKIEDVQAKAGVLCSLGTGFAEMEEWAYARQIWDQAVQTAQTIKDSDARTSIQQELITAHLKAKLYDQAEHITRSLTNRTVRDAMLQELANTLITVWQWEWVERVALSVSESDVRVPVLRDLVVALMHAQEWQRAQHTVGLLEDLWASDIRVNLQRDLVAALLERKEWSLIEKILHDVRDTNFKGELQQQFLTALLKAHEWERAEHFVVQKPGKTKTKNRRPVIAQQSLLHVLLLALAKEEQWQRVEQLLSSVEESAVKVELLEKLVAVHIQTHQWDHARKTAAKITDTKKNTQALHDLCLALANERLWSQAIHVADQAIRIEKARSLALRELADQLAEMKDWEQATHVITLISADEYLYIKAAALQTLVNERAKTPLETGALQQIQAEADALWDQVEEGIEDRSQYLDEEEQVQDIIAMLIETQQWTRAEQIARAIVDYRLKVLALCSLAEALTRSQLQPYADTIWTAAENTIENATDDMLENTYYSLALQDLALALTRVERVEHAERIWNEAETVIFGIEEEWEIGSALYEILNNYTELKLWDRAKEVAAKIEDSAVREEAFRHVMNALADNQKMDASAKNEHTYDWKRLQTKLKVAEIEEAMNDARRNYGAQTDRYLDLLEELEEVLQQDQNQNWEEVEDLWIELVHEIESASGEEPDIQNFIEILVKAQQWERAAHLLATRQDSIEIQHKVEIFQTVVHSLIQRGLWKQAEYFIEMVSDHRARLYLLADMPEMLTDAQKKMWGNMLWESGERTVQSSDGPYEKVHEMQRLASALTRANQHERAMTLWKQLIPVAKQIEGIELRVTTLHDLSMTLAQQQQWDSAEQLALAIETPEQRNKALLALGAELAAAHQEKQAKRIWHIVLLPEKDPENDTLQAEVLLALCHTLIKGRHWSEAASLAWKMRVKHYRTQALFALSEALAKANMLQMAENIASMIEEEQAATEAFLMIATHTMYARQTERARALLDQAEMRASAVADTMLSCHLLVQIGLGRARMQHKEQAYETWKAAVALAQTMNRKASLEIFLHIGAAYAEEQDWDQAEEMWNMVTKILLEEEVDDQIRFQVSMDLLRFQRYDRVRTIVFTIKGYWTKNRVLSELALSFCTNAQQQAEEIWAEADGTIEHIESDLVKSQAIQVIALAHVKAHHLEKARALFSRAESVILRLRADMRATALLWLGEVLEEAGLKEQAHRIWKLSEDVAHGLQASRPKAELYYELGCIQGRMQQWEYAYILWHDTEQIIQALPPDEFKIFMLLKLGRVFFEIQHMKKAQSLWTQAEHKAQALKDRRAKIMALSSIAEELAGSGAKKQLLHLVHSSWRTADTRTYATSLLPLANGLILAQPEVGLALGEALEWVDDFLKG